MNDEIIQQFIKKGKEAIELADFVEAYKAYRGVLENSKENSQKFSGDFKEFMTRLRILAFPNLSDEESLDILRNNFLELLKSGIYLDGAFTVKLFEAPYLVRDDLRKKLKQAILENQQKIGQLSIGQWIVEFEKMFPSSSRDTSSLIRFSIEHPQTKSLSSIEREDLKKLLHTYDYFLTVTLPVTGSSLKRLLLVAPTIVGGIFSAESSRSERGRFSPDEVSLGQYRREAVSHPPVSMALIEGMKTFPNLGEQVISSNPIKLRYFPTPVKPSIKNWITDYHDALGQGKHGTIDRGNFLFQSENGKKLTPDERQKVSNLLKSLDEGTPLEIDGDAQKVIFSIVPEIQNIEKVSRPTAVENVSGEDVAQMRIKQSLNFVKNLPIQKENVPKALEFEDSNYASALRERISASSQPNFGESKIERKMEEEKPKAGSLRFSSAQELLVEKRAFSPQNKGFVAEVPEVKMAVERTPQSLNSPDFKRHISQPATVQPSRIETPQNVVRPGQNQVPKNPQRVYSPYVIGPTNQYEKKSDDMDIFKKNSPKIQGNTVDLS